MLEEILSAENMRAAYRQVVSNKGAAGIDGMGVDELHDHLWKNWSVIKSQIQHGTYMPCAVRKVEIPKPNGGKRMLGIPTVTDHLIQQAIAQKLNLLYDGSFSESSFGFRPGRSAHQAVERALEYFENGKRKVVEMDLEKFFDRVNHDKLMSILRERITDKPLLKLIRRYLQAGIMEGGLVSLRTEGTPQGSPLSPILSNILLDKLDKELEKRKLNFVRYADDCSIYVGSQRAAERVLQNVTRFLEDKLLLRVNREKSKISRPDQCHLLGFGFRYKKGGCIPRVSERPKERLKEKIRTITKRNRGVSIQQVLEELNMVTRGWINYFRIAGCKTFLARLDGWIRIRLRTYIWKKWQFIRTRIKKLKQFDIPEWVALTVAKTRKGAVRIASTALSTIMTSEYLKGLGFIPMSEYYYVRTSCLMNRRVPNGTHGGVRGRNGK